MEQGQSDSLNTEPKVPFPLRTKLLLSIVPLLLLVIAFLDFATIFLFREDKEAYIYQSQATEAQVVAKEFVGLVQKGLDLLRLTLPLTDPTQPLTLQKKSEFKNSVANQSQLMVVQMSLLDAKTGKVRPYMTALHSKAKDAGLNESDFELSNDWLRIIIPDLTKNQFTFFNFSKVGLGPILGIAVVDTNLKFKEVGYPMAVGFVPLDKFALESTGSHMTIANSEGWVLFDSDPEVLFKNLSLLGDPLFQTAFHSQLASGAQQYNSSNNERFLGTYLKPFQGVVVLSNTKWRKAMKATYDITEKFVLLGFMTIGLAIIFTILFAKSLTRPLKHLYAATREVSRGNFKLNLRPESSDEIGVLSDSFNKMSLKINQLIQESIEKVRMEQELSIASTVQQTLLPKTEFKNSSIQIMSHYQSATECGGDWWGYIEDPKGQTMTLLIADATGHGVSSALITAAAHSCFSTLKMIRQMNPEFSFSPAKLLAYANRVIYEAATGKIMMTFFACVIDFKNHTLTYANAGHNPPWLFQKKGDSYQQKSLITKGVRLGEKADLTDLEEKSIKINPKDILFLYTDGLLEGTNAHRVQYGKKQTRKILEANIKSGPEQLLKTLISDFKKHNGTKPYDDDVTLAIAELYPRSSASA